MLLLSTVNLAAPIQFQIQLPLLLGNPASRVVGKTNRGATLNLAKVSKPPAFLIRERSTPIKKSFLARCNFALASIPWDLLETKKSLPGDSKDLQTATHLNKTQDAPSVVFKSSYSQKSLS
jgi:hypothetical protein